MKTTAAVVALATLLGSSAALPQFDLGDIQIPFGPAPAGCAPYEIIIARGTTEPGAFGLIVGDRLVSSVKAALPGARGYAVQYPADSGKTSVPTGATDILNRLKTKSVECPNMKFALVGYSQGASVIREALKGYSDEAVLSKVVADVMFGDPGLIGQTGPTNAQVDQSYTPLPTSIYRKLREFCAVGDPVCGRGSNFLAHLGYSRSEYATPAADFIIAAFKGTPQPAKQSGNL